jgi:hypothetical protein
VEFVGLAALEWFFSSPSFHFINKYLVFLFSAFKDIFVAHKHTHLVVRSQYLFSIGIRAWYTVLDLFLECNLLTSVLFIFIISQNINSVPPFDGTNYGYWKARMRFFLKSIDI